MALPSSGAISLQQIQTEFGGPGNLKAYYRGGSYVPNISYYNSIPTSGAIAIKTFYGFHQKKFLAITGDNSKIAATSPDGITWTQRVALFAYLNSVAWNGSIFCAICGTSAQSCTSPDGINWTYGNTIGDGSNGSWQKVAWNGSVFAATSYGVFSSSTNGLDWDTGGSLPGDIWTQNLGVKGSTFCVLNQGSSNIAATSSDGITWTQRTLPATRYWSAVSSNGSVFCAISAGSTSAATSPDGITWTARTMPSAANWIDIAWNGSVFCAIGDGTSAATSPDGITWTARTLPSALNLYYIAWNGSVFCAINYSGTSAATSPDGITWTARTMPSSTNWIGLAAS